MPTERPRRAGSGGPSRSKRLAWFVGLWAASIAALGAVASVIKFWIG